MNFFAVEVKTMPSLRTIKASKVLRDKYGCVISLEHVGIAENSTKLFRELVPTSSYRAQVLHHAATLGLNKVLYVVGTCGSTSEGGVVYICHITFSQSLRHNYAFYGCYAGIGLQLGWAGWQKCSQGVRQPSQGLTSIRYLQFRFVL